MRLGRNILKKAAALAAAFALAPAFANATALDTSVVETFPKDVAQISYLDLKAGRQLPWFPIAEQTLLPLRLRKLEVFLSSAGLDVETQVDTLAWGTVSATKTSAEGIVGVAAGHFSPSTVENYFSDHNLPTLEHRGVRLLDIGGAPNALFLAFLDSSTAAFGERGAIEQLLAVHFQGAQSLAENPVLYPLIRDARQDSLTWTLWNKDYARTAVQQLLPQASRVPQAALLLDHIQSMEFDVVNQDELSARSEIRCSTPTDAVTLAALLQAGIAYRQHESAQSGSQPSSIFNGIRVSAYATRVEIQIPLGSDQLESALRSGDPLNLLQ
ncbi:MAG TPA: hypothetical protein VK788_00410 [Terriglobales bacterium]|nr:hypothetical protein [Terriglobales bacterium]